MRIQAIKTASKRTINRIREHGPIFMVEQKEICASLENQEAVFVRSNRTGWFGWLPTAEIMILDN